MSQAKLSQGTGVRRFDVVAVFGSLWLLASMVIDAVTPKELTVYTIGATIAPATGILAVLYWLKIPRLDFAVIFATLWMVTGMVLEIVTPTPLSSWVAGVAVVPLLITGIVVNLQYRRRSKDRPTSTPQQS
jgi:hypothetical protein